MQILAANEWSDYELLDSGHGKRLERFGAYRLVRPDPQIIWQPRLDPQEWSRVDAVFERGRDGRERWNIITSPPKQWQVSYKDLSFFARLTPFKHTGIFPEQAVQWDFMARAVEGARRETNVLNLFGYTGIASLACAARGARVTHVDASKPTIAWARKNQAASGLSEKPIRWIVDDAITFTRREMKRGVKYDGIVMDPPIYGHGPNGEIWDFHKSMPILLEQCSAILSQDPLFLVINAYAISSSAIMLGNILNDYMGHLGGNIEVGELVLKESSGNRMLSTGIFGRWRKEA